MLGLAIEFIFIFLFLPFAYWFWNIPVMPLLPLWIVAIYGYLRLRQTSGYTFPRIWNAAVLPAQLPGILLPFFGFLLVTGLAIWRFTPDSLFYLVRHRTWLWVLIMLLYPILSAFPQALIYRAFLMSRYERLFHSPAALIVVSAVTFSFMHIIFRNPIAVSLTFLGGLLFAWRYRHTGSLAVSTFEHALYGCALFTLGLGRYFYIGHVALR